MVAMGIRARVSSVWIFGSGDEVVVVFLENYSFGIWCEAKRRQRN